MVYAAVQARHMSRNSVSPHATWISGKSQRDTFSSWPPFLISRPSVHIQGRRRRWEGGDRDMGSTLNKELQPAEAQGNQREMRIHSLKI